MNNFVPALLNSSVYSWNSPYAGENQQLKNASYEEGSFIFEHKYKEKEKQRGGGAAAAEENGHRKCVDQKKLGQKYPTESVLRFRWMCVKMVRSNPWQPKNWLCTTERIKIQIDIISNQVAIYTALANSELLFIDIFQGVTQTLC